MHLVFEPIASMNGEEPDKTTIKPKNRNRNEENRRQIIDFIADNGDFRRKNHFESHRTQALKNPRLP